MENSVFGDCLVFHGKKYNGRDYREEREAVCSNAKYSFFFLTRVYDEYVEKVLGKVTENSSPDVIVVNSCLWDLTRWGPKGVEQFKVNLKTLMKKFQSLVPDSLVIWLTTPPISSEMKGGFLVPQLQFLQYQLRFYVMEANYYAQKVVIAHGFDVLDIHYHLKMQIHRRTGDGIHWLSPAVRFVTNLLLTHISLAWGMPLPHRYNSIAIEDLLSKEETEINFEANDKESASGNQSVSSEAEANSEAYSKDSVSINQRSSVASSSYVTTPQTPVSEKENSNSSPNPARKKKKRRGKRMRTPVQKKPRCMSFNGRQLFEQRRQARQRLCIMPSQYHSSAPLLHNNFPMLPYSAQQFAYFEQPGPYAAGPSQPRQPYYFPPPSEQHPLQPNINFASDYSPFDYTPFSGNW
ncbi:uncharacterized protein LOC118204703 isoform X2 [Stegodyphus dumicola]|nr:uncharacterized protein LOC118204703 isoform X2 [Stegodyphus dumicola]